MLPTPKKISIEVINNIKQAAEPSRRFVSCSFHMQNQQKEKQLERFIDLHMIL